MFLDIFALIVMGVLIAVAIAVVVKLGPLPGQIARSRGHPQAEAIMVLGWVGIVTLGLAWPIALVWAYTRSGDAKTRELSDRIVALETELAELKVEGGRQ